VDATVVDNPDESRYEISVEGKVVGLVQYETRSGLLELVHTETDESVSGQGLGSQLIKATLDDARSKGRQILPRCPFVKGYISRHPEYTDLVPEGRRKQFGLTS